MIVTQTKIRYTMKTLVLFLATLTLSFSMLANDDEVAFSANVEQTDRFHTAISFHNASDPVHITVFNDADGIILSEKSTATDFRTELDYFGLPSGTYTAVIETQGKTITKHFVIHKENIDVSLTLLNKNDGILLKQDVKADSIQDVIAAQNLTTGEYLLVIENENGILDSQPLHIK